MNPTPARPVPWPPTPPRPIPSYYRCPPPNEDLWAYYDGTKWVGDPIHLPWYRVPVGWARGRAPCWAVLSALRLALVVAAGALLVKFG
jgi:hypothetical protein